MSGYKQELQFIDRFLKNASTIASDVSKSGDYQQIQKSDGSPVTIADVSIQMLFNQMVNLEYPDASIIGEESDLNEYTDDLVRKSLQLLQKNDLAGESDAKSILALSSQNEDSYSWITDPIEGTKGMLKNDSFATTICHSRAHNITTAGMVIYKPNLSSLSDSDDPIFFTSSPETGLIRSDSQEKCLVKVSQSLEDNDIPVLAMSCSPKHSEFCNQVIGDLGVRSEDLLNIPGNLKIVLVATGIVDAYIKVPGGDINNGKPWDVWDIGPMYRFIEDSGGYLIDFNGNSLDFSTGTVLVNNHVGYIAANSKELAERILQSIKKGLNS